jgi:FkbM family methyltransferase
MNLQDFKEKIKAALLGYSHFTPAFSQAGEDMILANIFRKIENGTYVDIGAFHPLRGSNTHYFYRFKGWTGINIEPNPEGFRAFQAIRTKDTNLNMGVSSKTGKLHYYMVDSLPEMNTFSLEFLQSNGLESYISRTLEVQTYPLSTILDQHLPAGKSIDILSVDVEGFDLEVLQSNNWQKYRPTAIIAETGLKDLEHNQTRLFLESLGYTMVGLTPVNTQINYSVVYFDKEKLKNWRNY